MIVLCVSLHEAEDLIAGKPSKALIRVIRGQAKLEALLPDDNLPVAIVLERVDDSYACTYRCYGDARSADRAMQTVTAEDRDVALKEAV